MSTPVGIVLASRSVELAAGPGLLVEQICSDAVPVAPAAGIDDGRVGTGYELALNATKDAERGAGVLVLPDLGGSVPTTLVDAPSRRRHRRGSFCRAPSPRWSLPRPVPTCTPSSNPLKRARHVRKL
ncbi:PTS-dependent dihydroxyacetone kinase phosphotransferase subunit DhaM [Streptomyces sp. NPDC127084]|uniref:PTS-dependent dihydroxyacetone kinase phosphotransferase subunit DhaM n=1 Tax=Streptomyces sp. NPDC127084 TaxID=3347133 RepID=UPI00365F4F58